VDPTGQLVGSQAHGAARGFDAADAGEQLPEQQSEVEAGELGSEADVSPPPPKAT